MKMKKLVAEVLAVVLFTLLTGCFGGNNKPVKETAPVPFPEGVTLAGFYMTRQSMEMEPYYILRVRDDGIYMKITNVMPSDLNTTETDGEPASDGFAYEADYFGNIDTVADCEYASLTVVDDSVVRELEQAIAQAGALSWNGYNEHRSSCFFAHDAGTAYNLMILLSDGSTVTASGYNVCPEHWDELFTKVIGLFEAHENYPKQE